MHQVAIPWRVKVGVIVAGYAGVALVAAALIIRRYLAEQLDPSTFNGGMAAGGDWFLELFLVGLLLVPTFLLALIIRNSETAYTKLAKVLLGFALALPVCVGLMAIPAVGQSKNSVVSLIGYVCLYRVFAFPMTVVGFAGCCVLAKFRRPRRLILYSVGIEIMSVVLIFAITTLR